jgi:hypothetical protein
MKRHISHVAIWLVLHRLVALARVIDTYQLDASANHLSVQDASAYKLTCVMIVRFEVVVKNNRVVDLACFSLGSIELVVVQNLEVPQMLQAVTSDR